MSMAVLLFVKAVPFSGPRSHKHSGIDPASGPSFMDCSLDQYSHPLSFWDQYVEEFFTHDEILHIYVIWVTCDL